MPLKVLQVATELVGLQLKSHPLSDTGAVFRTTLLVGLRVALDEGRDTLLQRAEVRL